jgi:hypothetical protein
LQPQIFVRNTTAVAATVGTRFNWRSDAGTGSAAGPSLHLVPFETRRVDLAALQKSGVIPAEAHWASVELAISEYPDDIMAVAASYDSTLRYGTQTPFNDQLTYRWEGGEWHVDATHNSIITAGNGGAVPIKAQFTLYYESGTKRYDLVQALKPHEQMWVDVGKLIRERTPDENGAVLPPDLTMGSYEIQDLTDRGVGNLYEGKVIVDKTYGHAAYGCATCCGWNASPWMYYDPIGVGIDYGTNQDVWDRDNCTSQDTSVLDYISETSWNTGNHAIAMASRAVITGVAVGSTTNAATGTLTIGNINSLRCPQAPVSPSGPVNTNPTITNVKQVYGAAGFVPIRNSSVSDGDNYVSYTASCNPANGDFSWTTSSGNITLENTSGPTVTVYGQNPSTNANDTSLQVTCSANGQTSSPYTVSLTVQQPNHMSIVAGSGSTTSEGTCTVTGGVSGCGVTRTLTYQVYDQLTPSNPIQAQLDFFDGIANVSGSNGCNLTTYTTTCPTNSSCGKLTGTSGTFPDMLSICANACISSGKCLANCASGPTLANQTWTVNGFALSTDVKSLSYNCSQVLVNGQ